MTREPSWKFSDPMEKRSFSSGDPVENKNGRDQFVRKYQEMNRLVEEPDGTVRLYIGAENWPLPIPLVNHNGAWYFDTGVPSLYHPDPWLVHETMRQRVAARRCERQEFSTTGGVEI
jgi:hypothetical protein